MKVASPLLLPLLRSRTQGDVLAWILLQPDRSFSILEIAEAVGTSPPTVTREVNRLVEAGLASSERRGNIRLIQAVVDNPVYRPLAELLAVTFGPIVVLRESLSDVPGIEEAFIYGSWAERYVMQPGHVPNDLDLLVIGDVDRRVLDDALHAAERRLRREVNVRRVTRAAWEADDGSFKRTVMDRPRVSLIGGTDE
jgi:DNA-binding transcriptional ArsR family regulator